MTSSIKTHCTKDTDNNEKMTDQEKNIWKSLIQYKTCIQNILKTPKKNNSPI